MRRISAILFALVVLVTAGASPFAQSTQEQHLAAPRRYPLVVKSLANVVACYDANYGVTVGTTPRAVGTVPPIVTLTSPGTNPLTIVIDGAGARGTATFAWYLNPSTPVAAGVLTAATVVLGTTGITANFPIGTYSTDDQYTSTVASVTDQCGSFTLAQATAALQPNYWFIPFGQPGGGQKAFWFSAITQVLTNTTNTVAQPNTVIVACEFTGVISSYALFEGFTTHRNALRLNAASGQQYAGTALALTTSTVVNTGYVFSSIFNGVSSSTRQNGVSIGSGDAGAQTLSTGFGMGSNFGDSLKGYITKMAILSGVTPTLTLQMVEKTWGIDVGAAF